MLGTVRCTTVAVKATVAGWATVLTTETATGRFTTAVVATEGWCATVLTGLGKTVATVSKRTVWAVRTAFKTATLWALFLCPGWTVATEVRACIGAGRTVETTVLATVKTALGGAVKAATFGCTVRAGKTT